MISSSSSTIDSSHVHVELTHKIPHNLHTRVHTNLLHVKRRPSSGGSDMDSGEVKYVKNARFKLAVRRIIAENKLKKVDNRFNYVAHNVGLMSRFDSVENVDINELSKKVSNVHKERFIEALNLPTESPEDIVELVKRYIPRGVEKTPFWYPPEDWVVDQLAGNPEAFVDLSQRHHITYHLDWKCRLFVFLENSQSCTMSKFYHIFILSIILLSVISTIVSSDNRLAVFPDTCEYPVCENDITLCPNSVVCEPTIDPIFNQIEHIGVIIFAIDYFPRLLLCWTVEPALAGLVSENWKKRERIIALIENREQNFQPIIHPIERFSRYFFTFSNFVDFFAVVPNLILYNVSGNNNTNFIRVIRLVRLARLLSIFKLSTNSQRAITIIHTAVISTLHSSYFVIFLFCLTVIIFGNLIFIVERGQYTVTTDYPNGAFMRYSITEDDYLVSPFVDISSGMYWAVITLTTCGYGDLYPLTVNGRIVACFTAFSGVIVLAFPVSLLGSAFTEAQAEHKQASEASLNVQTCVDALLGNEKHSILDRFIHSVTNTFTSSGSNNSNKSNSYKTKLISKEQWIDALKLLEKKMLNNTKSINKEMSESRSQSIDVIHKSFKSTLLKSKTTPSSRHLLKASKQHSSHAQHELNPYLDHLAELIFVLSKDMEKLKDDLERHSRLSSVVKTAIKTEE